MSEQATHDAITRIFLERVRLIAALLRDRFPMDAGYGILPGLRESYAKPTRMTWRRFTVMLSS